MADPKEDPQLLSQALRTKLGLPWTPQWDQAAPPQGWSEGEKGTIPTVDPMVWHPSGYAPMPMGTYGTVRGAQDLNDPAYRKAHGLPPRTM